MKSFKKILAFALVFGGLYTNNLNVYANIFNDVNKNEESYVSIQKMVDMGLMVGDLQGNFNKEALVSKFDAMKIFAKVLSYDNKDMSNSKFYSLVLEQSKKYSKWDSSSNNSIVFLLEKGVLTENDINQFIIIDKNSKEQIRALSKEELASFLVKIENKQDFIQSIVFTQPFKDEQYINKQNIASCHYMDAVGILKATDNYFSPKTAITRGDLAIILDKFLQYANIDLPQNNIYMKQDTENIQTRIVTIEKVFMESSSIQTKVQNETKIYSISKNTVIKIDGNLSNLNKIPQNSIAEITIKNNIVTNIEVDTTLQIKNAEDKDIVKLSGIIKTISKDSVGISYMEDNDKYYLSEKLAIIPLYENAKISKSGVYINEVPEDSLVTVIIDDKKVSQIIVEENDAVFIGNIVAKDNNKLVIKTTDDKIFCLTFLDNVSIVRNGQKVKKEKLKIGDSITINTNKNKIQSIQAKGEVSTLNAVVKGIEIKGRQAFLNLEDTLSNGITTVAVDTSKVNIHSIDIFDKAIFTLDSLEVIAVEILEKAPNQFMTGKVLNVDEKSIDIQTQDNAIKKVFIDENTTIFDYETLKDISIKDVKKDNNLYIVFDEKNPDFASSINIVQD